MRGPGIEPGSTAWKAEMLTITPATLIHVCCDSSVGRALDWRSKGPVFDPRLRYIFRWLTRINTFHKFENFRTQSLTKGFQVARDYIFVICPIITEKKHFVRKFDTDEIWTRAGRARWFCQLLNHSDTVPSMFKNKQQTICSRMHFCSLTPWRNGNASDSRPRDRYPALPKLFCIEPSMK